MSASAPRLAAGVLVIFLLTAAGAALRAWDLDGKSLWRDEVETAILAGENYRFLTGLSLEVPHIPVPPLYFYVTRFLCSQPGLRLPLRWPAVIFGTLLIPALWLLGREVLRPPAPTLAAAMLAVAPLYIRYSQEARGYSLLGLLGTVAAWCLVRAVHRGGAWNWAGFAVCVALALYTHHFALLMIPAAAAYLIIVRARAGRPGKRAAAILRTWPAWAFILAVYLPMVGFLVRGLVGPRGLRLEAASPNLQISSLPALLAVVGPAGIPWMWLTACLAATGAAVRMPWRPGGRAFVFLWAGLPLAIAALVPFRHALRLRYLIHVLPVYYFLAAAGLAWLAGAAGRRLLPLAGVIALGAVLGISALAGVRGYYLTEGKQDWRSVARFLDLAMRPGDLVLVDGRGVKFLNNRSRALEHYAALGERVLIIEPGKDPSVWLRGRDRKARRLWYVNVLPKDPRRLEDLLPAGREALAASGWRALPPLKFDAGVRLSAGEVWWLGPTRYRSLVVVPLRHGNQAGNDETVSLLAAASAIPRARIDESFTRRFLEPGGP